MSRVCRINAMLMKREEFAKYRPGHVLWVYGSAARVNARLDVGSRYALH